jgi:hypothetical protein
MKNGPCLLGLKSYCFKRNKSFNIFDDSSRQKNDSQISFWLWPIIINSFSFIYPYGYNLLCYSDIKLDCVWENRRNS